MASSKTSSTTKSQQQTKSNSSTASVNQSQTATSTVGGSHSETSSHSEYGSDTYSQSHSQGGAHSTSSGKSGYTGQVDDYTAYQRARSMQNYTPGSAVLDAYDKLQAAESGKPTWQSNYENALKDTYDKLMNYGDFHYNYNEDPIWQALKGTYTQQGKQAMQDTIGQGSALSGGYDNSYAQTAAQQQYQNYLQSSIDQIPTLRQQALSEWEAQRDRLQDQFSLTNTMNENDYNKYRDRLSDWQNERNYAQNSYQYADQNDYNRWNANRSFWNDEYWKERQAETSNYSEANEANWNDTNSESHTRGWEDTHSVTDATNWSNSISDTFARSLSNTMSNSFTNALSQTNSSTNSLTGGSGGRRSGSGSGKDTDAFSMYNTKNLGNWYTLDSLGNYTGNQNKYVNGKERNGVIETGNLTSAVTNRGNRENMQNTISGMSEEKFTKYLDDLVNKGKMNASDATWFANWWEDQRLEDENNERMRKYGVNTSLIRKSKKGYDK